MALKLVNLSKRIDDRWILRDVSLTVERGEIFGVFGPSGAGKSILLSTILGTSSPSTGAIAYDERDVTKSDDEARAFTAPRSPDGSMWQRLRRNRRTTSENDRRIKALHEAIAHAGKLLILDDPFCGLDSNAMEAAIEKMRTAVTERSLSVIVGSSDFVHILDSCDRAAVLVGGEVRQIGSPQDIYEHPESRVVASVTGRNNLFAARRLTSSKADIPEFHTLEGGHRLFAQRIERGALGALNQNVTLAIRPEQISLSFGASFPADNLLKATVTGIRFRGASTLIGLDADGLKLEALVLRLVGLNIGDECMVGLPPDRIQIFKD